MNVCPHCRKEIEDGTMKVVSNDRIECPHCEMNIIGWDSLDGYSADTDAYRFEDT